MKKLLTLIIISGVTAFLACGPSAKDKAEIEKRLLDSIRKSDSLKTSLKLDSLKKDSLAKTTIENSNQKNNIKENDISTKKSSGLTAVFINKNDKLILTVNSKEFIIENNFVVSNFVQGEDKSTLASCSIYGASGGTNYVATLEQNGDIKVESITTSHMKGQVYSDKQVMRTIKKAEY